MTDPSIVLDASAVLDALPKAAIGTINLSEVVAKLAERGVPADAIRAALDGLDLATHAFGAEDAFAVGALRPLIAELGLGLADRACLALAARLGAEAMTADRAWHAVPGARVRVRVIR